MKKRAENQLVGKFFNLLRGMELFETLDDFDLQDLALLMKLEKYPVNNAGEIVSCKCGKYEGKNAVFYILAKQDGQFSYTRGLSEEEKELPVLGGFMGLIMEGLRRIDEKEAGEEP